MPLKDIETAIAPFGLIVRGAFHPDSEDGAPIGAATLVLVGNAGPDMWRAFERGRRGEADPLDSWCRRGLSEVAADLEAVALFPFDGPPWLPFLTWAMRADAVFPSPIGPLIHRTYGLWHAYRGALAFATRLDLPVAAVTHASPCDTCADKPCLAACPVDAFATGVYDVPACADFVAAPAGAGCLERGCAARRACPIAPDYVYAPVQAHHHMHHFLMANRQT